MSLTRFSPWYRSAAGLLAALLLVHGSVHAAETAAATPVAQAAQAAKEGDAAPVVARLQRDGDQVVVHHAKGEARFAHNPKTVVVFDLATLDILHALGVDAVKGVPAFKMPESLQQYEGEAYTRVGSLFEPDYEAIRALRPDVILIGRRSESRFADLSKLAPTVGMAIDESHPVESIYANVRTLGTLFDKQEQAEALIAQTQQAIAELKAIAPQAGRTLLLLSSGGRINSYGPGSRFGMVFDEFGFVPVKEDFSAARHGQSISFEYILQTNPDWLLVMDRDSAIGREGEAARRLLDNALIHATHAARKNQIVYLDAVNWYVLDGAGIHALQANVAQLRNALVKPVQASSSAATDGKR